MTFEEWVDSSDPNIKVPESITSSDEALRYGLKLAFMAGREAAFEDMGNAMAGLIRKDRG